MGVDFGGIRFSGKLRPSQVAASSVIESQLKKGEKDLYIVAPPGSGKTILGLYVWSDLVRRPALVLSPNSAIQAQWIDRTSLFELDGRESELKLTSDEPGLLTSLTYQSLTMVRTRGDDLEAAATDVWVNRVIESGEAIDEQSALAWLEDLRISNPSYYEDQMKKHRKRVRNVLEDEQGSMAWLNDRSRASILALKEAGVGLVILDECHHLTEHWGKVLAEVKELLVDPLSLNG